MPIIVHVPLKQKMCPTGRVCTGGNPVTCTAGDQCHDVGTCDPSTGQCSNPAKANGTACSDGNTCTQIDTCQAGVCTGSNPVVCTASDQCHVAGTCDPATGTCSKPNASDGTARSDGNACTLGDTCRAGSCQPGTPKVCTASDQCHDAGTCNPTTDQCHNPGTCDSGSGVCSNPAKPNGASCSDSNACTLGDTCQNG